MRMAFDLTQSTPFRFYRTHLRSFTMVNAGIYKPLT